ncbi:hypothetical protein PHYBLDRAFT_142793 [Phycomyces blakesleeanus NRRL 1555(-)]|uniref:Uncharacterized protein n=1 Tax=Phycomyces blakesleeanus (strain ATCC 8743b / DSM 1359 / FGSC 10004 / NBRC 33097 / NRRL 1555) TaxID=763407 RepID=A0A162UFC4_PHYB8|nr:hypothetical protein PHYBLDRAFT_142793 [Phycomyces blakesleeanus NRRL 1555(-)]OAD75802.1 hypothetical protein PHYBLDRAFT_142793 [Phycomyces blakesleeanus NRRL 1555(-)]|eukprot:XP_018293842.1 hypothetical protein PHYBLDRAFT_142793 [Phycomyces blakesleeanus NRRL 1555(-)]
MLVKKQKFALAWFLKPGAVSSSKKVVETRIWLPGNPQTDNSRMTMAVVTPFDSQRGTSKVRHSVIQVTNRLKGPHIKMRSVRFTKRTSCRSVGPGAKPMRSEPKVDPEASGKFYGDTGIPRPFTVLFLWTIGVVIHVGFFG